MDILRKACNGLHCDCHSRSIARLVCGSDGICRLCIAGQRQSAVFKSDPFVIEHDHIEICVRYCDLLRGVIGRAACDTRYRRRDQVKCCSVGGKTDGIACVIGYFNIVHEFLRVHSRHADCAVVLRPVPSRESLNLFFAQDFLAAVVLDRRYTAEAIRACDDDIHILIEE